MAHFITVQEGLVTLNVDLIATVNWCSDAATVTMVTGVEIECEGESYGLMREAMGLDLRDFSELPLEVLDEMISISGMVR